MKVTESKRHRYPQMSIAVMFPYTVTAHVRDLSLTFRAAQQSEHVTDIFRGSFHKLNSHCSVTWKQKCTKSCNISSEDVLRNEWTLAPRSQGPSAIWPIAPCKARGRIVRSVSAMLKSEVKLFAEACKAQTSCLFCQHTANKMRFSWCHCSLTAQHFLLHAPAS